ncbi:MAG: RNA polymerase sigma factor WhiG [Bacillota bacterium]
MWESFKSNPNPEAKEKLILKYAPLVRYVAGRVAIGLPPNIEIDDLVSYGTFGLIDAIEKFDITRGIKFETYAISRIRGAILDGLRSSDWVPRSVRQKAKELERVCNELENKYGRSATDEEICSALKMNLKDFHQLLSEVSCTTLTSLDELWAIQGHDEDSVRVIDLVKNQESMDPSLQVELGEIKRILAGAIDKLTEREKTVIALYYYEGLTLKEIGEVLDVSESRVSQIHTKAVLKLRGKLYRYKQALMEA